MANKPTLVTLGMFIIDEFEYLDEQGNPTGKQSTFQIGGGGTYAAIGARIWLQPDQRQVQNLRTVNVAFYMFTDTGLSDNVRSRKVKDGNPLFDSSKPYPIGLFP
ncbi:hypothetical protein MPER_11842, partial [Moniliophthora perniciosa FA553]